MYEKYYSLAQSYSTHYLEAQLRRLRNGSVKREAFRDALETRLHAPGKLRLLKSRQRRVITQRITQTAMSMR